MPQLVAIAGAGPVVASLGPVDVPRVAGLALLAAELAALEGSRSGVGARPASCRAVPLTARAVLLVLAAVGLGLRGPSLEICSPGEPLRPGDGAKKSRGPYLTVF